MKIGIFGGTFNPIHNGHLNMIIDIKERLNLDVIYFVPSFKTPDKEFQIEKISAKHRYEMVSKVIKSQNFSWLKVSNFEYKSKSISYTFKTIKHFKEKYPNDKLFWIMGEDRYKKFNTWKKYNYIKENASIVIYRRSENINKVIKKDKSVIYLSYLFIDISSSYILMNFRWDLIPQKAKDYILNNKLYLKTIVFNSLKFKRYEHSVAVASHAKRLAKEYKYKDIEKAWFTGLIHDLFKLHSDKMLLEYKAKRGKEFTDEKIPLPALHGFIVALWVRDQYGWKDKEIFSALASHTLAKKDAKKLDKIIYVADKISSDRKGDKIGKLRKLAYLNLDLTYKKMIKESVKKLKNKNIKPHKDTIDAYKQYVKSSYGDSKYEFKLKENKRKIKK